jgi:hypothetical protein
MPRYPELGLTIAVRKRSRYADIDVDLPRSASPTLHVALVQLALECMERIEAAGPRRRHFAVFGSLVCLRLPLEQIRRAGGREPSDCVYTWSCLRDEIEQVQTRALDLVRRDRD